MIREHQSTIDYFRRVYSNDIPPAQLDYKLFKYSQEAAKSFDPKKNASFKTHLSNHLAKLKRDVHSSGSTIKTGEEVGYSIHRIKRAKDEFYMVHGREPENAEIAKAVNLSEKIVGKYDRMSSIKAVRSDTADRGSMSVKMNELLPNLNKTDKAIVRTITGDMGVSEALKHTGLSKSSFYRKRDLLSSDMKESYLRMREKNTQ